MKLSSILLSVWLIGLLPCYTLAHTAPTPQLLLKELKGALHCKITSYNEVDAIKQNVFTGTEVSTSLGKWELQVKSSPVTGNARAVDVIAAFKLTEGTALSTAVSAAFDFYNGSTDNYVLVSLMTLYTYTGDKIWLQRAQVQTALGATWMLSYDPVFPANSDTGKLKSNMAGAVWASIQNRHAAPGICTASDDYLFKLYRATGKTLYADLIRDIQHAHAEVVNMPNHKTTNNLIGSSMERIQPSDAEGKSSVSNFINTRTSWTETNGMLMALEVPGIYLQTDSKYLQVFDHVEAKILQSNTAEPTLSVTNNTIYDASVALFAETSKATAKPISYTEFLKWQKLAIKTGETIKVQVDKNGKLTHK